MDKKFELPPEMQAKIEEIKREHGVRELSKDELDGVAGGFKYYNIDGVPWVTWDDGTEMPLADYYNIIKKCYNDFGADVAIEVANMLIEDPHNEERLRTGIGFFYATIEAKCLRGDNDSLKYEYYIG